MKALSDILRAPFSSPLSAAAWIAFLVAWRPMINLAVTLAHASWHDALASFGAVL